MTPRALPSGRPDVVVPDRIFAPGEFVPVRRERPGTDDAMNGADVGDLWRAAREKAERNARRRTPPDSGSFASTLRDDLRRAGIRIDPGAEELLADLATYRFGTPPRRPFRFGDITNC